MNIVGYFHANERSDDYELGGVAKNIGDQICRYFPQATVLLVCIGIFAVFDLDCVNFFLFIIFFVPFQFFAVR